MNEVKSNTFYQRIYNLAQFQSQVAIAALPIGAGVAGFLSQQAYSTAMIATLAMVWLGLLGISVSIFLNLGVISSEEPNTPNERNDFISASRRALALFVAGAALLITSPAGFAINRVNTSKIPDITLSSSVLTVRANDRQATEFSLVMTILKVDHNHFEDIKTTISYSNLQCISAVKENDLPPTPRNHVWIKTWKIRVAPACPIGDEIIEFNLTQDGKQVGSAFLLVKISPD